jgi:hypothetical protein
MTRLIDDYPNRLSLSFHPSEGEQAAFEALVEEHLPTCFPERDKFELRWAVTYTPAWVGNCLKVKCLHCGLEKNLTDTDCW